MFGYDIFISYARADAEVYAALLEAKLEAAGFAVFRDKQEIGAGDRLNATLTRAIRRSKRFLLLDTAAARQSQWVARELGAFLRAKNEGLIRIRLGDATESDPWPFVQEQSFASETPLGVVATPDHVAQAVMAMIEADQVTGQDLVVDGGLNVKYP